MGTKGSSLVERGGERSTRSKELKWAAVLKRILKNDQESVLRRESMGLRT